MPLDNAMAAVYLIAVGIVLYFLSDRILVGIERKRGRPFEQRTIIFFFILLGLGLVTFPLMQNLLGE